MLTLSEREEKEIKKLSELLGIPIWDKQKDVFEGESWLKTSPLIPYELDFRFAHFPDFFGRDLILISPQSVLMKALQVSSFWLTAPKVFICETKLIEQKLRRYKVSHSWNGENRVSAFLTEILDTALNRNVSDIHLEEERKRFRIRLRINGVLSPFAEKEKIPLGLINKIKIMAKMSPAIRRKAQDGHFEYLNQAGEKYDVRVSSIPGIYGEKLVLRLHNFYGEQSSLESLNLPESFIKKLRELSSGLKGWLVMAGATGSGKTTTLYSLLKELTEQPISIMTIEDPVEYHIPNITQVEVNKLSGVNFSDSLRSFMRVDPDVIMIGEIRDEETAQLACKAAMTGHFILSSVHAGTCEEITQRLQSLGVSEKDLKLTLKLAATQVLKKIECECGGSVNCEKCFGCGVKKRIPIIDYVESF